MLALGMLQRAGQSNTSKIQKQIADILEGRAFQLFKSTEPGNLEDVLYSVDMVPIVLGECGMDFSVQAWQDATSELAGKLISCSEMDMDVDTSSIPDDTFSSGSAASPCPLVCALQTSESESSDSAVPWFEKLSREELLAKLHARDEENLRLRRSLGRQETLQATSQGVAKGLRTQLKQAKRQCSRLLKNAAKSAEKEKNMQKEIDKMKSMIIERRGKYVQDVDGENVGERGWLTPAGTVQLAIKRNLAHCASEHLQLLIQQDVSRWTVSRSLDSLAYSHMSHMRQ